MSTNISRSGKDKDIVDPDPEAIYTQRKQQRQPATSTSDDNEPPRIRVKFPDKGWGISLEKMPLFSRAEMNRHIENSGKQIANKSNNTVTTGLRKAKRFLDDEYLEEIQCAFDQKYFYIKSKCCHSYRKNDPSHDLKVALCVISGDVQSAYCSCVAGAVGYCNHVLALMFKLCKFSLYNCRKTTDKIQDDDDRIACTSKLQQWHKKGGGANIAIPVL